MPKAGAVAIEFVDEKGEKRVLKESVNLKGAWAHACLRLGKAGGPPMIS